MKEKICAIVVIIAYAILCWFGWGSARIPTVSEDGKEILTFWHTYGDDEEAILRRVITEWEKDNPKYTIRPVRIPFDGHKPKIRTALTVGQGPDMARVDWSFVCELARKNAAADLDTFGFNTIKDQYLSAPLDSCCVNGKYYGLPDQSNCVALFYNRSVFKDLGLLPQDSEFKFGELIGGKEFPKTWEEFIPFAKQFKDTAKKREPFAILNTLWWNLAILNTFEAKVIDKNKCVINSANGIEAFTMMARLYKEGVEAGGWKTGAITPESGFVNNQYVMILMGPWNLKRFKEDLKLDFGIALIPGAKVRTSSNIGGTDVVIFKDKSFERQKACYSFLTFFTNAKNQAVWCKELNQIPINMGAYDLVKFEDQHQVAFLEQMKYTSANPVLKDFSILESIVNPEVSTILDGQNNVKDALDTIVQRVAQDRLLDD